MPEFLLVILFSLFLLNPCKAQDIERTGIKSISDGTTTVYPYQIDITGATISDGGDGTADISITTPAPTDATYITQTANSTLTAEQNLSALSTGILKSTTGTGVVSIATAGTDYQAPLTGSISGTANQVNVTANSNSVASNITLSTPQDIATNSAPSFANLTSTVAIGTQPYACTSTTLNTNLNADLLDGQHASAFQAAGTYVTSVSGTSPIASSGGTNPTISISDSVADGATKGAATFNSSDFDSAAGIISIDYLNGQASSAAAKGFLTSADWTTFNNKVSTSRSISTTSPLGGGGDLSADRTFTLAGLSSLGTANYVVGVNSGAMGWEYKQILGTANEINITHAANSITIGLVDPLIVSKGGTGLATATEYAVICGGTTATGAFQSIASVGSAGQVLTSNGAGALPTFQAAGGGAPTNAQYVTLALDGTLSAERVLTGTANQITVTDGGANGNVTLSTPQDIHTAATPQFARLGLGVAAAAATLLDLNPTATSGTIAMIDYNAASTTAGALVGLNIDLSTNVTPGAFEHSGLKIKIPATTRSSANGEGAISISSLATQSRIVDIAVANALATNDIMKIYWPSAVTLTNNVVMLELDGATNVTAGASTFVEGLRVRIPASSSSASVAMQFITSQTAGVGMSINLNGVGTTSTNGIQCYRNFLVAGGSSHTNTGTLFKILNNPFRVSPPFATFSEGGTLLAIQHTLNTGGNTVTADTTTGVSIVMTPQTSGGPYPVKGLNLVMAANCSNAAYAATFDWRAAAGTAAGNGIVNIELGAATTLTGQLVGQEIDLSTNNTSGANACIGQRVLIPATTRASTALEGALVVSSDATKQRILDLDVANTEGTLGIFRYGTATTLTATGLIGLDIDLVTNVTGTTNDGAITGLRIQSASTDRASTAGEGLVVLDSQATAARIFDAAIANTSGTPFILRYRAATTPAPVTMATIDLSTNVTSNANANIGLDIPIVAADEDTTAPLRMNTMRVFVGTGAPNNANGTDGDEYHRIDGGALTSIYKKIAGVWTGIA